MAHVTMILGTLIGVAATAAMANPGATDVPSNQRQICKTVVNAEVGSKPYRMCLTAAEWKARKVAESKNANRMVCRYQEQPGTRFRSYKICLPQSEWDNQRLRERQAIEQIQMRSCVPGAGC
jgi:hypothetical protein